MNQIDNIMELADHYAMTFGDNRNDAPNRQALRTAIEQAINACGPGAGCLHKVARIEALEQALATGKQSLQVQEPVAWMHPSGEGYDSAFRDHRTVVACTGNKWEGWIPLYTEPEAPQPQREQEPSCKSDPRAPHGFLRNASHTEGRYVCECEFWEPPDDTALLKQALEVLECSYFLDIDKGIQAIAALKERLK